MRNLIAVSLVTCLVLSACSSTPPIQASSASAPEAAPTRADVPSATPAPVAPAETEAQKFERLVQTVRNKSVFFDFDEYAIKPQYQDVIKANADVMKQLAKSSVVLEGNADERGSTEYNLALGQRRAEAVGKVLRLLGIADERIEAISYGEEKPRAACHEEKCWTENRRVDFRYKAK